MRPATDYSNQQNFSLILFINILYMKMNIHPYTLQIYIYNYNKNNNYINIEKDEENVYSL